MNQSDILQEINKGNFELTWFMLEISPENWISVCNDALKIDGVRFPVSYTLNKQIADIIGAKIMTEEIVNLIRLKATIQIDPVVLPISNSWDATVKASQMIDKLITDKYRDIDQSKELISNCGKYWIEIDKKPGFANYGFFTTSSMWKGIKSYPVKNYNFYCIQPISTFHDALHYDYSQTCSIWM